MSRTVSVFRQGPADGGEVGQHINGQDTVDLTVSLHEGMTSSVSKEDWNRLFPGLRDSYEMVRLTDQSDMPGFRFHSILVSRAGQDKRPVLLLPLVQKMYYIEREYAGKGEGLLNTLARTFPRLFHAKILGIGFEEGEGGQVGYDPDASLDTLATAWRLALVALEDFARTAKADLICFTDFSTESGRVLPMDQLKGYLPLVSYPYGSLRIQHSSLEQYIDSLSKTMRKDIRRKLKKAAGIQVMRTRDAAPWADRIFALYQGVMDRTALYYAAQTHEFFSTVCQAVPGAEYVLYLLDGELVAFNLVVHHHDGLAGDTLVDKYFGMAPEQGRQYALYFVSWVENVRYCIEHGIARYDVGPATELEKKRLGADLQANTILIKHRNPFIQPLLNWLSPLFDYTPEVEIPPAQLGTLWPTSASLK